QGNGHRRGDRWRCRDRRRVADQGLAGRDEGRNGAPVHDQRGRSGATLAMAARMAKIARKSDGRRIFTDEFKREQIDRVWSGELTLAELSRKLGIARSLLQRWKRLVPRNGVPSRATRVQAAPASTLRADQYIRE